MQLNETTWWAMRKRHLRVLPAKPGYLISVWQGAHPSPEFSKYKVWYTGYRKPFAEFLKEIYGPAIAELLPQPSPLFERLRALPAWGGGVVKLDLIGPTRPPKQLKRWKRWKKWRRK